MRARVLMLGVALALLAPGAGRAALVVSLSTNAPDLSALQVGNSFTVSVNLSGLTPGDQIEYLAVQVNFDPTVFSATTPAAGAIITDPTGFAGASFPDSVDGNYDNLFATTGAVLDSDGVFYSFGLTVTGAGSGSLSFGLIDAIGFDSNGNPLDVPAGGGSLPFSATGTAVVPAPATGLLLLASVATLLGPVPARRWLSRRAK